MSSELRFSTAKEIAAHFDLDGDAPVVINRLVRTVGNLEGALIEGDRRIKLSLLDAILHSDIFFQHAARLDFSRMQIVYTEALLVTFGNDRWRLEPLGFTDDGWDEDAYWSAKCRKDGTSW